MSEVITKPPHITPGRPNIDDKEKSEPPKKWIVLVSHNGYLCRNLLHNVLEEIFNCTAIDILGIWFILQVLDAHVSVTNSLPRDFAETKADLANKFVGQEQKTCKCNSSIKFEALPIPESE